MFSKRENNDEDFFYNLKTAEHWYYFSLQLADQINKADEIAHAKWGLAETNTLYYEKHKDELYRRRALLLSTESNSLYGRMATPGDFKATLALKHRLENSNM